MGPALGFRAGLLFRDPDGRSLRIVGRYWLNRARGGEIVPEDT